jgi:hypothetical protein
MPCTKVYKKKKKIIPYRDFIIVNATTQPKIRDLPNVLSEYVSDDDGMRTLSGMNSMAFQMDTYIFDENVPQKRRDAGVASFFNTALFSRETINIVAYQIQNPNKNIYLVLEDDSYEKYIDRYISTMEDIIDMDDLKGNLLFSWNSVAKMKDHLIAQVRKEIDAFDKDKWIREHEDNPFSDAYFTDLEDDDYDIYLDNEEILRILETAETNREIRELFFRYAKYSKKQMKLMIKAIKKLSNDIEE